MNEKERYMIKRRREYGGKSGRKGKEKEKEKKIDV